MLNKKDIDEKKFESSFRGYSKEEVDDFLDEVSASVGEMTAAFVTLEKKYESLKAKYAELEKNHSDSCGDESAAPAAAAVTVKAETEVRAEPGDRTDIARAKALAVQMLKKAREESAAEARRSKFESEKAIAAAKREAMLITDKAKQSTQSLKTAAKGVAMADPVTLQTAQEDIFVGGDCYTGPKFAIDAIAAGREGAISLHRYVQPGQSLTLARNPRDFYELDKDNVVLDINCFDAPVRQEVKHDPRKAKTMKNDRVTFTEEQVKAEASRCLGCGVTIVDQNKCIGCGLCTTRCEFDAIHLHRDHPDASKMVRTDDKIPPLAAYAAKRAVKIKIKDLKEKLAK